MNFQKFHLVPAFSLETLARKLSREISVRADPMQAETVLVMNYAQRIWLQQFIAIENGICANVLFQTPEIFLSENISENDKNPKENSAMFSRAPLAWRIFKQLKKDGGKTFQYRENKDEDFILLAGTLADLFWRYQSFRPEMMEIWQSDEADKFASAGTLEFQKEYKRQKKLWRSLGLEKTTPPAVAYLDFIRNGTVKNPPKRLFVFAPTALPRIHMEILCQLSNTTEIFFYYHNLSSDLWTETAAEKQILRERKKLLTKRPQLESELKWQELVHGNELLASWGKAARPLAMRLIDYGLLDSSSEICIDTIPERNSILHTLQADIRENKETPTTLPPNFAEPSPASLQVNIAHSPIREMEILRNDLEKIFAEDKSVAARNVLVMMPNIEEYAPFIWAVFASSGIPFSIADKAEVENFSGISAFMSLLKIAQGEIRLSELLELLNATPLCRGLGINPEDVPALKEILVNSNARWGLDENFRHEKIFNDADTVPVADNVKLFLRNNSWEFALQRCAFAYMLGTETSDTGKFGDTLIAPADKQPESAAQLVGKFYKLLNAITLLCNAFSGETKSVPAWCDFLQKEILDTFFVFCGDEEEEEKKMLCDAINSLRKAAELAELDEADKVGLKTAIATLEAQSWESKRGAGMLRGKVTFCTLQPLRNIPAEAIYIAGMNSGKFPRASKKSSFDLVANWPKQLSPEFTQWDRTPRDEDCLLLLEAVLAAKKYLRFSYIGKGIADNSEIPPCTPLAKLVDYLKKLCGNSDAAFLTNHPLASSQIRHGNALVKAEKTQEKTFPLSEAERELFENPSTETLAEFYTNPAKFICEKRLLLRERYCEKEILDDDPTTEKIWPDRFFKKLVAETETKKACPNAEKLCLKEVELERIRGKISVLTPPQSICDTVLEEIKCLDALQDLYVNPGTFLQVDASTDGWNARVRKYFRALEIAETNPKTETKIISFVIKNKTQQILNTQTAIDLGKTLKYWKTRFLKDLEKPPFLFEEIPSKSVSHESFFEEICKKYDVKNFFCHVIYGDSLDLWRERINTETFQIVSEISAATATEKAKPKK